MRPYQPGLMLALLLSLGGWDQPAAQEKVPVAPTAPEAGVPWTRYVRVLIRLYELGSGAPVWLDDFGVSRAGHVAAGLLLAAGEHGLDPAEYNGAWLDSLARHSSRAPLRQIDRERFDALLSVNLIRYLDDLQFGRLHPMVLDRTGADTAIDLALAIRRAISADSIPQLVAASAPQLAQYRNLQRLLARYRALAADSSLSVTVRMPRVVVGDSAPGVGALRQRLMALGDLPARFGVGAERYNGADSAAVQRFQFRHGLPASGVVDWATLVQINVPPPHRVRQIELALERLRWLPPIGRQRFLVVNIPAFQLFAFDSAGGDGVPALRMRVIVGNALDNRTPVLFERLRYVEFRPSWNVPYGISVKELIPALLRDPAYLVRNTMKLVDSSGSVVGDSVTPVTLEQIRRGELRIRQLPGGSNPLGLIKFVFPNAAAIYLHGTPRIDLFAHTRRDFSHGCIRLEDPTTLAAWVLRDHARWNPVAIAAAQRGSRTVRAHLVRPMPVVIFYTTAVAAPDGSAWFYRDIYGHDRRLDAAQRGDHDRN